MKKVLKLQVNRLTTTINIELTVIVFQSIWVKKNIEYHNL